MSENPHFIAAVQNYDMYCTTKDRQIYYDCSWGRVLKFSVQFELT